MSSRLFIAEKKSLAETLAKWLARSTGQPCKEYQGGFRVGPDVLLPAAGHLYELADPESYNPDWAAWKLEDLPLLPPGLKFKRQVSQSGHKTWGPLNRKRLKAIQEALNDCTEVVHAGDPDDEGQAIVDNILDKMGNRKPVMRLWAQELSDAALARSMSRMLPNASYHSKAEYARARDQADWLHGLNYTRAATMALRKRVPGAGLFSVGRVQTAVLGMVVRREQEIEHFVPVEHYVPWVLTGTIPAFKAVWKPARAKASGAGAEEDADKLLTDRSQAQAMLEQWQQAGMRAQVADYSQKPGVERPPLTFSLSDLQRHCSKRYGYSADQTLSAAQALYEARLTSYPRTDSPYMPEDSYPAAWGILQGIARLPGLPAEVARACTGGNPSLKSRAWNSKKIASHYAIMPIELPADAVSKLKELGPAERKVYLEIVKRFALQFWPDAKVQHTHVELTPAGSDGGQRYHANGKVYTFRGWKDALQAEGAEETTQSGQVMPALRVGQAVPIDKAEIETQHTRAPARFTEDTLLGAMENAWKYVRDPALAARLKGQTEVVEEDDRLRDNIQAGIGTQATRASILSLLKKREFVQVESSTYRPTPQGRLLIQLLPEDLSYPDQTALWQMDMDKIKTGANTRENFIEDMARSLQTGVPQLLEHIAQVQAPADSELGQVLQQVAASSTPKTRMQVEETEFPCPVCATLLERRRGVSAKTKRPFDAFFCTQCAQWRNQVDGRPETEEERLQRQSGNARALQADASAPDCPACGKHKLKQRTSAAGRLYWSCLGYFDKTKEGNPACQAMFSDLEGRPDLNNRWDSGPPSRGKPKAKKAPGKAVVRAPGFRMAPPRPKPAGG